MSGSAGFSSGRIRAKSLPMITALCATKDRPLFVRKAVELFLAQTWPNKELLVLDDGDPALTPGLASSPQVRHVRFEEPTSVSHKHRAGFQLAHGEFLCYWDDDDWYGARRLETQAAPLLRDDADIVGTWIDQVVTVPDVRFYRFSPGGAENWAAPLPAPCGLPFPFHDGTAMWRRSLLDGITLVALPRSIYTLCLVRIQLEVSAGELMDRIAILEIKLARLSRSVREAVLRDLSLAQAERNRALPQSERLRELGRKLHAVNLDLWEVEEELRACEREGVFGARFVELARQVYTNNDRRAALKRSIDELVGCALREHKSYALPEV